MSEHPSILLETIAGRLDKSVGLTRLQHVLQATREELEALREDFGQTASSLPDYARRAVAGEVAAVEAAFEAYQSLVRQAKDDEARLEELQEPLRQAAEELNVATLAFREAALCERGPTPHAGLNLVLLGARRPQDLELLLRQSQAARKTLDDLDPTPFTAPLRQFHRDYEALLENLPEDGLEERCAELGRQFQRLDLAGLTRRCSWHPTALPAVNLVLHARRLQQEGHVGTELAQACEDALQTLLDDAEQRLEDLRQTGADSPLKPKLEKALSRLRDGDDLEKAAHFFASVWTALAAQAQEERGRVNVTDSGQAEGQTTVRAERVLQLAEAVLAGGDEAPLIALLDEMERQRTQAAAQLQRLAGQMRSFSPAEKEQARKASETFEEAISDMGQALAHFRELARTRSRALLRPAAENLWNSLDRIFEVQHLTAR